MTREAPQLERSGIRFAAAATSFSWRLFAFLEAFLLGKMAKH
ncbi:MAG: hypothetical protein ABL931_01090 [Usitatibacteraceae bacterium]